MDATVGEDAERWVDMVDVDTPEVVPAPRAPPQPTKREQSRLSSVPLDDVIESLSRSPSTASSSSSSSSASSAPPVGQRPRRVRAGDLDDVALSIPTEKDLYGDTRHHRSRRRRHSKKADTSITRGEGEGRQRKATHSRTRKAAVDVDIVQGPSGAEEGEDDALLRKMRRKEKEFDAKIKEINSTFFRAGRQLVVRDDIIERLQAELAQMRSQARQRSRAEEQRYREKERELVEQCDKKVQQTRRENEELQTAAQEARAREKQQQSVVAQLMQQLTDADTKMREMRRQHEHKLDTIRAKCQEQLQEFDRKFAAVQRRCAELEAERDDMQSTHAQSQAKLLGLQMELSKERDSDTKAMKDLWKTKEAHREEVEAVRMSMARLLHVMAAVPELEEYLRWNELDSSFVFLGYPTRYFPDGGSCESDMGGANRRAKREGHHVGRECDDGDVGSHLQDLSAVGGVAGRALGTGVDDGIYAGVASFQDSKNVWLNGRWVHQLQEIINAENMYTRLKKIKLYELEEAGQVSDNLPTARDVLQCRRQEKDYWVPYAIFQEAQHFKNKYYPKIPALSHFYPFLMRLNAIWHAKLQDRVRTLKKDLQTSQQQLFATKRAAAHGTSNGHSPSSLSFEGGGGRVTCACPIHGKASDQRDRVVLFGVARRVAEWESQHEHLRRQIRLSGSNQRSSPLFKVYGNLLRDALATVKSLARRCQALEEESAFAAEMSRTLRSGDGGYDGDSIEEDTRRTTTKGRRAAVHAHRRRRAARYSGIDDREESLCGSEEDEEVEPLPPPPARQPPSRKASARRTRGRATWSLNYSSDNHSSGSGKDANAERVGEEAVEALLCVVQHSSERVCGVADYLAERTLACCNDLETLMSLLSDVYLPSVMAPQAARATSSGSSASSTGEGMPHSSAMAAAESSTADIQKRIRSILREQYGSADKSGTRAMREHSGAAEERERAESPYTRAMQGMKAEPRSTRSASPGTVLSNIVASVFDFSREVREEVLQAQKALQVIAAEAMREAGEA